MAKPNSLQARTAAHYDAYPLEFLTATDEVSVTELQPPAFRRFVDKFVKQSSQVAEIGCGPGRGILYLVQRKIDVVAIDISFQSLLLARRRAPGTRFILSSNAALPFEDSRFDIVISDGVIHHTPNPRASFAENVRITRGGGYCYFGIYKRRRYYYYLYTFIGAPIRWCEKNVIGRMLMFATIVPIYWVVHLVKSRGKRTWRGAINFFYDYFITPKASFHTYEEICRWGHHDGLELIEYDSNLGNVHVFVFRKPSASPDVRVM